MPGGWPPRVYDANAQSLASVSAGSTGTSVAASATNNTYGSWTQLIASTSYDISRLVVIANNDPNANSLAFAIDIAAAASGSESSGTIISALMLGNGPTESTGITLPVGPIKAGTRLAARCAAATGGNDISIQLIGLDGDYAGVPGSSPGVYDTYGWSGSGTVTGLSLDPGATANTKGAYTQLTASTTHDLCGFFLGFDGQNTVGGASSVSAVALLDIALGASGSEKIILPNYLVSNIPSNYSKAVVPALSDFIYMPIKAGTRIAARCQSANTTSGDRSFGLSLYGLRA